MENKINKIDFAVVIRVEDANPNGDPLGENRPRTDADGVGMMSAVSIKRKIRNRLQDEGENVLVRLAGRGEDGHLENGEVDAFKTIKDRALGTFAGFRKVDDISKKQDEYIEKALGHWTDVRWFGAVLPLKDGGKGVSIGLNGPVTIREAKSAGPVEVQAMQITKCLSLDDAEAKGSDTMGMRYTVPFGVYVIKGSVSAQVAEKYGFTNEDADKLKKCLRTLFRNDATAARPDGSMEVLNVYWWNHSCPNGQYSSAKVHNSLKVALKPGVYSAKSLDDLEITLTELPGLVPEVLIGE